MFSKAPPETGCSFYFDDGSFCLSLHSIAVVKDRDQKGREGFDIRDTGHDPSPEKPKLEPGGRN